MKTYIALKDNLERIFLSDKVLIRKWIIKKGSKEVFVEKYKGFYSIKIPDIIRLFFISQNSTIKPHNDFIDVTGNKLYKISNILNGSLKKINIIIEGADGIGKSTLVNELAQQGYLSQDRAIHEVTQSMREYIPKEIRVENVRKYLAENKNRRLIILYLSDEEVLRERILNREEISEYDKKAIIYQRLYIDTYFALKDFENIFLIDVLGKSPKQIATEIIKLM